MERVGVRELKDHLGHYLRVVRQGQIIVVTMRGKAVAHLVPISPPGEIALPPGVEERMWKLAAEGFLTWNGSPFQIPEPAGVNRGPGLLSDLVVEDRE
ncbi:MAG TPA: type II toxin-antitoxin system prevent-host-death family antitoxin [Anaerolineae bacterium]|jgi:prevent-host-death family protein|nr:type II toxin-antitoxin system prevent-host-death family antitoxin [Anaerolineae bacterium]